MHTSPDWVLTLGDADLERRFGAETLGRGRAYARASRVGRITRSGALVMAEVRGSDFHVYRTSVVCQAGPASLVATCTCPVRRDCKHAAALLLHLRAASQRRATPTWRQALDPLLHRAEPGWGGAALALQLNDRGYGLTLRPLKRGQRDAWVKSGATWDDLRYLHAGFDPGQREALLALAASRRRDDYGYGARADALPLASLRADAWEALRRAVAVGVPLLAGEGPGRQPLAPPLLVDAIEPVLTVDADGDGLLLTPAIRLADAERVHVPPREAYVGRPPHGIAGEFDGRLVLGPLSRPLDEAEHGLFLVTGPVRVPAEERALFAAGFLPQLRRRLGVEVATGVDLPEPPPPRLVCRVRFAHADRGTASVTWAFRYRLGEQTHDLALSPHVAEPQLRDLAAQAALAASVPEGPWRATSPSGAAELLDAVLTGRTLIRFASEVLPELRTRDDVDVELDAEPPAFREAEEAPTVSLRVTDSTEGDWFDLGVEVTVGGERVPFGELFAALASGEDHLLLDSGTWFSLELPELERLRVLIAEARILLDHDGDSLHLRPEHAGLWQELVSLGVIAEQSAAWRASVAGLLDHAELPDVRPPEGLRATLRPYQQVGFAWLTFLWRSRLGGVLADEMGLGKTLQALALAQSLHEQGELDAPLLVVAPTSVLGTWAAEAHRFTPELNVVAITETGTRRGLGLASAIAGAHIVLTSYTLLRLEEDEYRALDWSAVLLDEAQFVKNHASKAYRAVRRLRSRLKVALTGTPLENNLMDLWSLLSITAPGLFPDPRAFTEAYRRPVESGDAEALARLHRRIRPLILRRTKAAVATELPDKQEQVVPVPLAPAHRRLYDRHLARERQKVLGLVGDLTRNRITILRSLTLLRQLSLAPALVDADYPAQSAKIDTLVELLGEIISEGHRALVFSQFTGFLALVRKRLDAEDIAFEYLDGRTRDRPARIASFREGDAPVFLISLKAGGFGLTLTEADYVFILDPWWNPAAETQAIDRTHRIGQDKPVNVYRLVSQDTIEEKVVALQERKRDLFASVVGRASDVAAPLSAADIRGLLDA